MQGRITKGIGGFYYVCDTDGAVHECKARGRFRKEKRKPMVGDLVEFEEREGYSSIEEILPRKNALIRPAVSNVDKLLLVVSAGKPVADLVLIDQLLVQAAKNGVETIILINKTDEDPRNAKIIEAQYSAFQTIRTSAKTEEGIERLKKAIYGNCVCLAGQSAVGKSSLLNRLDATLNLETGGLSKKTDRGRHTTRRNELFYLPECNAYIMDTPGFSMFAAEVAPVEIGDYYPEFKGLKENCRFASCLHDKEPDCAVKHAVDEGIISSERYERYLKIIHSLEVN